MSSTRRAPVNAPLSQEKYLSSPEYAELRGLSGVAVAAKAALLEHPAKRSLLWFLQALSLEPGGLKKVAAELVTMFPERLGTPTMHRLGITPGRIYTSSETGIIAGEIDPEFGVEQALENAMTSAPKPILPESCETMLAHCRSAALAKPERTADRAWQRPPISPPGLVGFMIDLCINPRVLVTSPSEPSAGAVAEMEEAIDQFPEVDQSKFRPAGVPYFRDIIGALYEYQRRHAEKVRAEFVLTGIGRKVWETLDFALKARRMVLIDGLEGRGKTEAVKAWCRLHLGEARFISLKGITGKTNLFRAISVALGIGASRGYSALEMQNRIEDVLHRSGLAVIFDEAHFLFDPKPRMYSRPELVDWVDTALCNYGVPVGLVSTPQLLKSVQQAGEQTGWNHRQFRRRVKRYVQLPESNTDADLMAVARRILPGVDSAGIMLAVGYAVLSKRDVSGLGDVAEEARLLAREDGLETPTFNDLERAIKEHLVPSDAAFVKALRPSAASGLRQRRGINAEAVQATGHATAEPLESEEESSEEAPARRDLQQRETRPANLTGRIAAPGAVPGSHRQTQPAFVPA